MVERYETPRTFEQALLRYRCGPGRHDWETPSDNGRMNCQRCGLNRDPESCEACGRPAPVEKHPVAGPDRLTLIVGVCSICSIGLDGGGLTGWRIAKDAARCAK